MCKKTLLYTTNIGNILQCDLSKSQFKCNLCTCLFSSAIDLKMHMKIHIERINYAEKNNFISENVIAIEKNTRHSLKELIVKVKRLEDSVVKDLSNKKTFVSKTSKPVNIQLSENNIDFVNMSQKTSVKATQKDKLLTVNNGDETEKGSISILEQKSYLSNNKDINYFYKRPMNQSIQKPRHKKGPNVSYTKLKVGKDSESIMSLKKLKMTQHNKCKSSTTMSNEIDIKYNNVLKTKMYKNHNIISDQEETDIDTNRLENIDSELDSIRDVHQKSKGNLKNSLDNLSSIQKDDKTNSIHKMSTGDGIEVDNNIYKICKNQKSKIDQKYEIKQMEEISIDKNTLLRTNEEADKLMKINGIRDGEKHKLQKIYIKSMKRYKCQLCSFKSASEDCLTQHSKIHICNKTKMPRDKTIITSNKPEGNINQNIDVLEMSHSKATLLVSNAIENIANNNLLCNKNHREQADEGRNLNKEESSRMRKKSKMNVLEVPCNKNNILGAIPLENDMAKQLSVNSEVVEKEKFKICKLSNTNKKQYKCVLCNFKTSSHEMLVQHVKVHNYKKIKTVNDITMKSNKTSLMRNENAKAISKLKKKVEHKYKWESCDIKFLCAETLRSLKASHQKNQVYNCNMCDYYSKRYTSLKFHLNTHSGEKPYKCKLCPYKSAHPDNLTVHKRIHQGDKPYKCKICGYGSTQSSALKMHSRIHTGERPYKCEICDFRFTQLSGLKSHINTHTKIKPYKCKLCNYASSRLHSLKLHSRIHTGEKPYQCSLCDYSASFSACLKQHMYVHIREKPFKCTLCSYASSHSEALNVHMRTHTGEKPFKCKNCDFRCSRNSSLKLHNRIHTGERPYHCNVCQYSASRLETVKVHMRLHTGEQPYLCTTCGTKFSQQSALKIHNRIHTGERPYTCMTCGFCSVTSSELKKHIMRTHKKHL